MLYLSVCILLVCLSIHYDINEETKYKDFWYLFILAVFILIAGLRYRLGVDTLAYMNMYYHLIPDLWHLQDADDSMYFEPFYYLLCSVVKSFGGRFYVVQLLHATFVCVLLFKYIKKHSRYVFACLFLFFIWTYTSYFMETMRASMAIVICLFANDYMLERKWLKGVLLYLLAFGCHNSSILLIVTPLFLFLRFNIWGLMALMVTPIIGMIIQNQIEDYILLMDLDGNVTDKAVGYLNNDRYMTNHNILYYLIDLGIYIYYSVISFLFIKYRKDASGLMKLQPFVVLGLVFVLLKDRTEIFYRFVDYYKIYFIFYFVELFIGYIKCSETYSKAVSALKMIIVFIPLLYVVMMRYANNGYVRYYPYSSVIERSINQDREHEYKRIRTDISLLINRNEY